MARNGPNNLAADSGMVSNFQPASNRKSPAVLRAIQSIQRGFMREKGRPDRSLTTEIGAASAASPATYAYSLYSLRYERRAIIQSVRDMIANDNRAKEATIKFAQEAVRKGCTIVVDGGGRGPSGGKIALAKERAQAVQKIGNPKAFSWAWMLHVEGDLFVQAVVSGDEVIALKRMPADGMERNTNDADEFSDPSRAFSQVDVITNQEVDTFPLWMIHHQRWLYVDGERYGQSELLSTRRAVELMRLAEDAQVRRRIVRAPLRRHHEVGNEKNPGNWPDVEKYKEQNGMVEGRVEQYNPVEVGRDYFSTWGTKITNLDGDQKVHEVDDLRYLEGIYTVGLPTPSPIYGLHTEGVNRDVLDDLRAEWLKKTASLTDAISEVMAWAFELDLLLHGILPDSIKYTIQFSESSLELPSERLDRVVKARGNVIGSGKNAQPDPLISKKRAIQRIAEDFDITDVEAEEKLIQAEMAQARQTRNEDTEHEANARAKSLSAVAISKNGHASPNGNGKTKMLAGGHED